MSLWVCDTIIKMIIILKGVRGGVMDWGRQGIKVCAFIHGVGVALIVASCSRKGINKQKKQKKKPFWFVGVTIPILSIFLSQFMSCFK